MTSPQNQAEQLSSNDRSKYVTAAKPLKTQYFGDFDVVKF